MHNDVICDNICSSGYFEREIVEPFEDEVFPKFAGRTFLDVGANMGMYTLLAAACGLRVVAFEPMS